MFIQRAIAGTVWKVLCVPVYMNSLPFCQYAMAVRGSRHWWLTSGVTNVSSSTSAAFLNPASTSPYDHSSGAWPMGSSPSLYSAKSSSST